MRHNSRIRLSLEVNQIRREMLQGREHLVAPVIAVQEMILPNTSELLPAEEIEASVPFWEGVAVAIDHPTRNGEFASANEKGAIEEQVVGRLFEMFFHAPSKQLRGEMWIDLDLADRVDRGGDAVDRIEAAERTRDLVEVSTSYFAKVEQRAGSHDGQQFEGIQRELRPDHLAILLDDRGACSTGDGCGVPRSQEGKVKANIRSSARRPTFRGTEETPWSGPTITQWIDGYVRNTGRTRPDTNRVADLPSAVRTWIASRTLLGEATADNERDLTFFPVVRPSTNRLNAGALRAVLGGRGAQARIPEGARTSAQNMARRLLEANFGDRNQTGGSKVNKGLLTKALDLLGRAIGGETMDREKTIEALVANAACPFKAERLEEFSDEELTGLSSAYLENKDGDSSGDDGKGGGDGDAGDAGKDDAGKGESGKSGDDGSGDSQSANAALSDDDREAIKVLREIGVDRLKELATSEKERRNTLVAKLAANKACSIEKTDLEKMPLAALEGLDRMLVPADYSGQGGPYENASSRDSQVPKAPPVVLATPVTNADDKSGDKK